MTEEEIAKGKELLAEYMKMGKKHYREIDTWAFANAEFLSKVMDYISNIVK